MRLLEFQAKSLFTKYGIPVPESTLVRSRDDLVKLGFPRIIKAQVLVGSRAKAGVIRTASQTEEAKRIVEELLNSEVEGYLVQAVLVEEQVQIKHELYLAILIDKLISLPLVMVSATGGVDIEEIAKKSPEKIIKRYLQPFVGLQDDVIRYLGRSIGLDNHLEDFNRIVNRVYSIFHDCNAVLVEINPLALTENGLIALDAKILLDDKATSGLLIKLRAEQKRLVLRAERTEAEQLADERDIIYIPLDGDIGVISDGAGTGMFILDLIHDLGSQAANFCELGGLGGAEKMQHALEVVHANPRVRTILIGLIGGLTLMDEMAEGIVRYITKYVRHAPLIIRMCGIREETGKAKLRTLGIETYEDLEEAVRSVVRLARSYDGNPD